VYKVSEGTWIAVDLLNRGVEVVIDLTCLEVHERDEYTQGGVSNYDVRLAPREENRMAKCRVGGHVIDVQVQTWMGRPLGVHLQFEKFGESDGVQARGPGNVGCLLEEPRRM
jgi:hypothetical protein